MSARGGFILPLGLDHALPKVDPLKDTAEHCPLPPPPPLHAVPVPVFGGKATMCREASESAQPGSDEAHRRRIWRSPPTVKREFDRHRDADGRYLPQTADHTPRLRRRRPRLPKLVANAPLRRVVQRS
jgi:hypothetical protein